MLMNGADLTIDRVLDEDEVRELVPSAFALSHLKNRVLAPTNIIKELAKHGFKPTGAVEKKVRKATVVPLLIRFAREDEVQDDHTEVVLYHHPQTDGAVHFLYAGYKRTFSDRSIICGEGYQSIVNLSDNRPEALSQKIGFIMSKLPDLELTVSRMRKKQLTKNQCQMLALQSIELRWPYYNTILEQSEDGEVPNGNYAVDATHRGALHVGRNMEPRTDLWSIYNLIHEAILAGTVKTLSVSNSTRNLPEGGKLRDSRPLDDINKIVSVNRALWDAAAKYVY